MAGLIARVLYTLLWHLLLPAILLRLWWRGRAQPGYREHLGERFGRYPAATAASYLWLHAVSVGETRAAQPLIAALRRRYPDERLLLTCMTPTGRDTARQLYGDFADVVYLPYDLPWATRRFVRHYRPRLGLLMETELWPNLLAACARAESGSRVPAVPTLLVNARLSERSARGYGRIAALIRPALGSLSAVAAQTPDDAARLEALGARDVVVCGNLKFDVDPPSALLERGAELRRRFGATRRVLLAASTREGEEELLLARRPDPWPAGLLWVIVPRHPQRFDEVAAAVARHGLRLQRRSADEPVAEDAQVLLGDSMGEMFAYYAACDLAFVGGSLLPFGAQNLIEAAAVGKPILIGPHTFNFAEATRLALECGAAETVADAAAFWRRSVDLLEDAAELERRGAAGKAFAGGHRGATQRVMALIERCRGVPDAGRSNLTRMQPPG